MSMIRLYYHDPTAGQTGFGWATANYHLQRTLAPLCTLTAESPDVVFQPLADHDLTPTTLQRGRVNFGYCFTESALGPNAKANAAKFDVVFCGSTWNMRQLQKVGIQNARVLMQGVDHEIFCPTPPRQPDDRIRIFSGGKFEYRKGQDLVIAAFKRFLKVHPNAHLVCAWHNPWPHLASRLWAHMRMMLDPTSFSDAMETILEISNIPNDSFTVLPKLTPNQLAIEMRNTDFGVFPNRCEGGTNLVLMEYLSCGKRAAANMMTGHADLYPANIMEITATEDVETGWAAQTVDSIVSAMENALQFRWRVVAPCYPWGMTAQVVIDAAKEFLQ